MMSMMNLWTWNLLLGVEFNHDYVQSEWRNMEVCLGRNLIDIYACVNNLAWVDYLYGPGAYMYNVMSVSHKYLMDIPFWTRGSEMVSGNERWSE